MLAFYLIFQSVQQGNKMNGHATCMSIFIVCFSQDGWTALHIAAQEGHKEIVVTLLEADADVNSTLKVKTIVCIL